MNINPQRTEGRLNHPDRLFPPDPDTRSIARRLFSEIAGLPLICPHGHTEPRWFADDIPFADAASLMIVPDHYVLRMLVSQGVPFGELGIAGPEGPASTDMREVWRCFAANYFLFRGTPTRLWLDHTFQFLFGLEAPLGAANADDYFDRINDALGRPEFRPRSLYERFNIETLATTDGALDQLDHHHKIASSDWQGRVVPTFRPDAVIDPDHPDFAAGVESLADVTRCDTGTWSGYLDALRTRRQYFKTLGAAATDHGVCDAATADLGAGQAEALFQSVVSGKADAPARALFRGQMLTEMARMSLTDGLVMQLHPGSHRNHDAHVHRRHGTDKGFDIPTACDYVNGLKPLLNAVGMEPDFRLILFTLDESALSRELAPLAGAYPCLRLGPPWWFLDSPDGMRRFRELTTETAGFYNTVGFNDDTRAFPSIPARHDMARRIDCAFLAERVADHRLHEDEAVDIARDLAYHLPRRAYRL